ncbi:TIGR02677 family protein [Tumebacillus permanentifrigoris]|uniref:Uncharacterized protein (TIGR02677 family) n=1 Tax=Tumebacillus permanentifrigoris TaxID=378543 RepID=A0A316D259_9BACL|nr:TIGR02677 family protein [Tumebacillus permanentifrigoris]PWK04929.1 uncharacterized protein (TIGR02677 family) [Tumebacillus permanentifrigoris]
MYDSLNKPIPEFTYLNARGNIIRYRYIMRFFYEQYERINYWLRPEEVYEGVVAMGLDMPYELEECQQDLGVLKEWGSLVVQHDGTRVTTIEEYLKKRFRYMMTPYAIEIERLVIQLEGIKGYGGALQSSKLYELARLVQSLRNWTDRSAQQAEEHWDRMFEIFKNLNEQAGNYIASLNSKQSEELYTTEAFLPYKDSVISYLDEFISVLQQTAPEISQSLRDLQRDERFVSEYLEAVITAKRSVPQLEEVLTEEEWRRRMQSQWLNFERWFLGDERDRAQTVRLVHIAKETIYKLVRCALRIQEKGRSGISRMQELEAIGLWFLRLDDMDDAHRLFAYAFGLYETRHFLGEHRDDRSALAETSMWQTHPNKISLTPRGQQYRQRSTGPTPAIKRKKTTSIQDYLENKQWEEGLLQQYVAKGIVRISELPVVSRQERQQLLAWIGRCLGNKLLFFTTPEGIQIAIDRKTEIPTTTLECEDGTLQMPDFTLVFRKEGE